MESVFEIIAEPNRRAILSLLVSSQLSVGDIERQLRMPQPTVSKHLRVLREAGFVESTADAQRRLYRLRPEPLREIDVWLAQFRRFWSAHVDALERHLDRMDEPTPMPKNTAAGKPAAKKPAAKGPALKSVTAQSTTAKKPATKHSAANKPAPKSATARKPATKHPRKGR
jgi:DNA-binding transcriptional ArsR family regulator